MREDQGEYGDIYGQVNNPAVQQQKQPAYDQNRYNTIAGYYQKYLGRTPDQGDQGFMGYVGNNDSLANIEKYVSGSQEAQNYAKNQWQQSGANSAAMKPAPTAQYLQQLLASGMDPRAAVAQFNKETGRTTGNEAVYYDPSVHGTATIGLPDQYLSLNGGSWGITQRMPEVGGRAASVAQAPTQPDPMLKALMDRITTMDAQNAKDKADQKAKADALYGQLQDRAKQSLAIDRNDPVIRAQADAYAANTDRASRNYLADLAEKAGPLANLRGEQRMAAEKAGQANAGFEAQLMGNELASRRAEISDALNSMRGMLTGDQQADLQRELASLDAAIKQQSQAQNQNQFGSDLAYRYANLAQNADQFSRNLANNQNQFSQQLGFNYENMDNDMLRYLMSIQ